MKQLLLLSLVSAAFAALPLALQAVPVTLGGPLPNFRIATLDSATGGTIGEGNGTVVEVETYFGGNWTEVGSVEGGNGASGLLTDGLLTVNVTSGTWGGKSASGTWTIGASFWTTYGDAAISLHVGGGKGGPDHFIWAIEDNNTSGTWSYDGSTVKTGGGLSNLKLYGTGTPNRVPDLGSTFVLLGLGLASIGLILRRRKV